MHYIKISFVIALAFLILFLNRCERNFSTEAQGTFPPQNNSKKVTINQGVWGDVLFYEGNFYPNSDPPYGTVEAVIRNVYIYKAATMAMVEPPFKGPFYDRIDAELVKIVRSDAFRFYQAELDTGLYSLFVKENSSFYANIFDHAGVIQPVRIFPDSVSNLQIDITYRAMW